MSERVQYAHLLVALRVVPAVAAALVATAVPVDGRAPGRQEPAALFDAYARHDDRPLGAIDLARAGQPAFVSEFDRSARAWVDAAPATARGRRALVAGCVALEFAHALRLTPGATPAQYIGWATGFVRARAVGMPEELEHRWYFALAAAAEELPDDWGIAAGQPVGQSAVRQVQASIGPGGVIGAALARFPADARLLFAKLQGVEARTRGTWEVSEVTPPVLAELETRASQRVPPDPKTTEERQAVFARETALDNLARASQLAELSRAYDRLSAAKTISAEVALRRGYLAFRVAQYALAHTEFRRAAASSTEPYVSYLADYLDGRTSQRLGDHAAARAAFERALATVPGARSAAAQLAAEIIIAGQDPARVSSLVGAVVAGGDDDPWRRFFQGDARLRAKYIAELRGAIDR